MRSIRTVIRSSTRQRDSIEVLSALTFRRCSAHLATQRNPPQPSSRGLTVSVAHAAAVSSNASATVATEPLHEFINLQTLVKRLREELPQRPGVGAPIQGEVVARVKQMLQSVKLNPREWRQHAVFRRGRYTRNIVGYSPGQFVALLLCWERGQQSPIHDHSGAHCFIKMMSGQLRERHFAWAEDGGVGAEAEECGELDASIASKSVGFMHDSLGLHRIENPSSEEVAVSLHIYSPPFSECLVFPPTGGQPKPVQMVSMFVPEGASGQPKFSSSADSLPPSLLDFCASLEGLRKEAKEPEEMVHAVLDRLAPTELSPMDWAAYASPAHFSEFHPIQHIIHCDDNFSVVVTCWSPGQSVPRHTVGRGRTMWLKVMHGNLTYQEYAPGLFPWECGVEKETSLATGTASIMEECCVRLHRITNQSETMPAVCVQVFSPPLTQFTYQTENGPERRDLPTALGEVGMSLLPRGDARGLMKTAGRWYLSFRGLGGLLQEELSRHDASEAAISALLRKAVFNPEEWRERLASSRASASKVPRYVLLEQNKTYTLLLSFWANTSEEPCVDRERREGKNWTLVLEGELEERTFKEGPSGAILLRSSQLKEDSLSFVDISSTESGWWVERSHEADTPCVSLHVFSPPLPEVPTNG